MAFRVDDIIVTEKNILLLSGGCQFIADIEKNSDALDDNNFTRDRNPWNFYSSDGILYHNLFKTDSFDVRTQTLTGSTRHSPNNSVSHESIFMPHDSGYVGTCQFYGNAYSITNFTNSTISSYVESGFDDLFYTYCSNHGIVRYNNLSSYENPSEYYISPNILFEPESGVQFITEYPLNGYYMDFGDNETSGNPTIFGDSVLAKYYLDHDYSVSSYDISSTKTRFKQIRSYYDIGNSGNSIYMVFRNNLNGISEIIDSDGEDERDEQRDDIGYFPISSVGYMSNIVTMSTEENGMYYSSDPYSDMFRFDDYSIMSDISFNLHSVNQPQDHSFILYINKTSNEENSDIIFTYIPTIGLERSRYTLKIEDDIDNLSIVELPHCVAIGTVKNGLLTVWSRDYMYDGGDTLVNFNPFQHACSGTPSFDSITSKIDGEFYGDIRLFYNNKDMLCATAVVKPQEIKDLDGNVVDVIYQLGKRIAFFSSNFDDENNHYEIGQFFMPAGNPLYEIEVLSSETPVYEDVLSSVPFSTWNESTNEVNWNFKLQNIKVATSTEITTSDPFQASANYISECDVLFDYSSTEVEGELEVGSYAFVQFEKYGLSKCHVDEIYSNEKMVKFSSTGPINRYDSRPEIWKKLDKTTDAEIHIKGNTIKYSDLSTIPSPTEGDIYSIIDEYHKEGKEYPDYTYFRYTVNGNTSSWIPTSLEYINGYVEYQTDLYEIGGVSKGDTYLVEFSGKSEYIPVTSYVFFQYGIDGNLSSWKYVRNDNGIINGRVQDYTDLPGVTADVEERPNEGDVYLVFNSHHVDEVSIGGNSFYIYDKEGADNNSPSIIKNWNTIGISFKRIDDYEEGDYLLSSTYGAGKIIERSVEYGDLFSDGSIQNEGVCVFINSGGTYQDIPFLTGEIYRYDSSSSSIGWIRNTQNVKIMKKTESSYADTKYKYLGMCSSFDQLNHILPMDMGSVYFVSDGYFSTGYDIDENSFYKYHYFGNQLEWWEYNIKDKIKGMVEHYSELKNEKGVEYGDYYLVESVSQDESKDEITYDGKTFYTFGIDGNTSFWTNSSIIGNVMGTVVNYANLRVIDGFYEKVEINQGEPWPSDFDVYTKNNFIYTLVDKNEDEIDENETYYRKVKGLDDGDVYGVESVGDDTNYDIDVEKYGFCVYGISGNTSEWRPVDLTKTYNLPLSGHKDSYSEIENLSGIVSALYYTESYTESLVFYRLETNNSVKMCTDATFSVISYNDDAKTPILDIIDYVSSDYSTFFVSGKPALRSTFVDKDGKITNSFSDFPLTERDIIKEPVFSTLKSVSAESCPISGFNFAMGYPIENSMGVSVKTFSTDSINHDASISLVKWNISSGEYCPESELFSLDGLHLQYNAICTDVYMNGTVMSSLNEETGEKMSQYSSTIYEYPHPCYGELRTAGTHIPIFDGPFSSEMTTSDIFFVNNYLVVKNYSVEVSAGHTDEWWKEEIGENGLESGKHQKYSTGLYPIGGYVVTNFFADVGDSGSMIPSLYDSELIFSSKEEAKTKVDSERFYDYNYLWHIKPTRPIEFYPKSVEGKIWTPYYQSKYVDFIKYHNGYYYISLRSNKNHDENTIGYDIIETDTLFEEKECEILETGVIVSGIRFFDGHVAVEYEKRNSNDTFSYFIKWFDSGKSYYKVLPVIYKNNSSSEYAPIKHEELKTSINHSSEAVATYDNVEVMNSLNRFTPVVNHKSNLFSIRIDDLGFEESEYLTEHQKKVLRAYFRNNITELVDTVKPAHTQLFDVYLD